jgi:hypothetical protein
MISKLDLINVTGQLRLEVFWRTLINDVVNETVDFPGKVKERRLHDEPSKEQVRSCTLSLLISNSQQV